MNVRAVWTVFQKDLLDAVRNLYILFALILPLGFSLIFGAMFPALEQVGRFTVAVYDPQGSRLVANLQKLPQIELMKVDSLQELSDEVKRKAVGVVEVPAGFDAAVQAGQHPELAVYLNRRRGGGEITAFQQLVQEQVWTLVDQEAPVQVTWKNLFPVASTSDSSGGFRIDQYLLILLLVMALAMTGTFVVPILLVEEKEKHTLDALLISPAGPAEVAAGKALTGMVYILLVTGILLTMNDGWQGNWPVTVLVVILGGLFTVMVGLLMGAVFRTTPQVNTWSTVIMLGLMVPSWFGATGLLPNVEKYLQWVPTNFMVKGLRLSLAGEASLPQVWDELALLLASVILVFAAVVWVLRRQER